MDKQRILGKRVFNDIVSIIGSAMNIIQRIQQQVKCLEVAVYERSSCRYQD
ncbi:MAG: hypothetical protein GY757_03685 [bacterium]|nr:hypothetical protein [bacterium]